MTSTRLQINLIININYSTQIHRTAKQEMKNFEQYLLIKPHTHIHMPTYKATKAIIIGVLGKFL